MYLQFIRASVGCFVLLLTGIGSAQTESLETTDHAKYHLDHQPLETGTVLNLAEAVVKTLKSNPGLLAFDHQLSAQEGRILQASLAPNPELNLEFENFLGTGQLDGISNLETTISIGWILERGVRKRRVGVASAGASMLSAETEVLRFNAAAETARRFLACLANQARIDSNKQAVTLAEQTIDAVSKRVQAGRAPDAELARAQAELAKIQLQLEDAEHELVASYHQLASQWGVLEPQFSIVEGELLNLPQTDSFEVLKTRIQRNPDIARFLSRQRLGEAELRLAQAQRKPNWRVNVGVRRFEAFNDQALVAGLTIPLTFNNRNQGRIMEAQAKITYNNAAAQAAMIQAETELFVLYQELQHSFHRVKKLRDDVVPRLEKALTDTREAYRLGRYSYFEWQVVQQDLLATRQELVEASANAHAHLIEIERLTGIQIAQPVNTMGEPL